MKIQIQLLKTLVTPIQYEVEVGDVDNLEDAETVALYQLSVAEEQGKSVPGHWLHVKTCESIEVMDYDDGFLKSQRGNQ